MNIYAWLYIRCPQKTSTVADYADNPALQANTVSQADFFNSLEQAVRGFSRKLNSVDVFETRWCYPHIKWQASESKVPLWY